MSKDNKTTKQHFEVFQDEARKWIKKFGLWNWAWHFRHDDCDRRFGQAEWNMSARVCTLTLDTNWAHESVTENQLRKVAFHEVCEVLLGPMTTLAHLRYCGEDDFEEAAHQVIRILENTIWENRNAILRAENR